MEQATIHLIDVTDFTLADGSGSAHWFAEAFETLGLGARARLVVHDGIADGLPEVDACCGPGRGVVVSGSYGPIWQAKPWIAPLMDFMRRVHGRGGWLLGICFGHHALAAALGGEVVMNPRGREMGSVPLFLTPDGRRSPLFEGFKSGELVNLVHRTHVSRMPPGAVRLAFNQITPTQAFSIGRSFGYQPHPEMTPKHLRMLTDLYWPVLLRREHFLDDGEHLENFRASFRETPSSMAMLRNFVEMTVS